MNTLDKMEAALNRQLEKVGEHSASLEPRVRG
ncbi:hypothetical protein M199_gp101 [Halogranum tailed virus 1]|uniref:Uncharacterized protein n=1 Tax=Halogranum tailed virus 1 TaxID=1273749 RepID=R4T9G1_9CAUD|nr:hypothetical protein M199_gp101 [Halogranum tailed virus 1]AGM11565.1 hypothetical protein HGTV1_268 [Halogranum tailed virus 1]